MDRGLVGLALAINTYVAGAQMELRDCWPELLSALATKELFQRIKTHAFHPHSQTGRKLAWCCEVLRMREPFVSKRLPGTNTISNYTELTP
jgi:hypothetical protein